MRSIGAAGDSSGAEGVLVRKHDWESTTKKAQNRSWDKVSFDLKNRFEQHNLKRQLIFLMFVEKK